jgi:hypothetical protein
MADGVEADMTFRNAVTLEIRRRGMVVGREDRSSIVVSEDSHACCQHVRMAGTTCTIIQAGPRTFNFTNTISVLFCTRKPMNKENKRWLLPRRGSQPYTVVSLPSG